tara:strand:- start:16574 stop:17509 length:936 start_codon:yes stop_codon:yes gene_type:complete
MEKYFEFEKDIKKIDEQIDYLSKKQNNEKKIAELEENKSKLFKKIYSNLNAWEKVQVSRHNERPHTLHYINQIFKDIIFLHGDKKYADDSAICSCIASIEGISVMIIGTEKGNTMDTRIKHNFGMAKPEGYRKAKRMLSIAEKFSLPVITFVDTAGAFPGKDAEERGQSESIASSIMAFLKVRVPTISLIIGEGGSGGAIGIAACDKVLMLEHAIYSVISPEGCASILWRSTDYTKEAAKTLKLTSYDCKSFEIIDEIIPEVSGGAHRFPNRQSELVKNSLIDHLNFLKKIPVTKLVERRKNKYLDITTKI